MEFKESLDLGRMMGVDDLVFGKMPKKCCLWVDGKSNFSIGKIDPKTK